MPSKKTFTYLLTFMMLSFWLSISYGSDIDNNKLTNIKQSIEADAIKKGANPNIIKKYLTPATVKIKVKQNNVKIKKRFKAETFDEYLGKHTAHYKNILSAKHYNKYKNELEAIEKKYGVPGEYIITIWGMETQFGKYTGTSQIIESLLSLIYYESHMKNFYRNDLVYTLVMLSNQPTIEPYHLISTHDGGMGQVQFQPSSYQYYAVSYDENKNSTPNIWTNPLDGFASIANFLSKKGWVANTPWGYSVRIPANDPVLKKHAANETKLKIDQWKKLGIKNTPENTVHNLNYRLIIPRGNVRDAFLVTKNYQRLMNWNPNTNQALTMGVTSDAVRKIINQQQSSKSA